MAMTKKEREEMAALRKEVGELREAWNSPRRLAEVILDAIREDIEGMIREEIEVAVDNLQISR